MSGAALSGAPLDVALPFHFVLTEDDWIVQAGPALCKLIPGAVGSRLPDLFRFKNSSIVPSFSRLVAAPRTLHALVRPDGLELRGEFVMLTRALMFVGSAWPAPGCNLETYGLTRTDFAIHDLAPDHAAGRDRPRMRRDSEERLVRARELAEDAARAQAEFLANMSHEIRTPMNAVIGMTSLLLETTLSTGQRDYVETIRTSGDCLLTLINHVLDFSKIESGYMELEQAPFDVSTMVESALELVSVLAARKGLRLSYELGPGVPAMAVGDVTRIRQILVNLLGNAVKFTERGEVLVTVARLSQVGQSAALAFAVRDTGVGIASACLPRLFRAFSQGDSSTTRTHGGSGLGLAICKRLIELMQGSIEVNSVLGQGSEFRVTIPVVPENETLNTLPTWRGRRSSLVDREVVVIDPFPGARGHLARMFREWGAVVWEAADVETAVRQIRMVNGRCVTVAAIEGMELDGLLARTRNYPELTLLIAGASGRRAHWEPQLAVGDEGRRMTRAIGLPVRWSILAEALDVIDSPRLEAEHASALASATPTGVYATVMPIRILIAEDHPINQKVALGLLRRIGCNADVASNGIEAIDAIRRQSYDLVLLDVQMPEMDGLEAAKKIAQIFGEQRPMMCAVTANASNDDRRAAQAAGMDDFLPKPITAAGLAEVVQRAIDHMLARPERASVAATLQIQRVRVSPRRG